ncbi:EAL domain-containing response regulator [Pseudomonas sp. OST1909]|uniref:EAL domain-containing response regulator n=1 Tax=Pseudomonas sp. OST1909 TaxID=2777367 RepID=UPI0018873511|nr:EAL domain-containing response regulator [Pseudomonas sp. OST1909]QOY72413.1 EAL domain-containing response regulator [Pseudomonas sp. OST1909]
MNPSSITILVLEEHAFQRSIALMLLERAGDLNVLSASCIKQALRILQGGQRIDILMCDLRMDSIESLMFLRQARQKHQMPSIILSGSLGAEQQYGVESLVPRLGFVFLGTLDKPLQLEQLVRLLSLYRRQQTSGGMGSTLSTVASEIAVRRAFSEGQIQSFYQPKFNLLTDEIEGVEVLVRWHHPQRGILSPYIFMPVLERCGMLNDLLFSQLHHGLALQKSLRSRGRTMTFAYNLEVAQLASPDLIPRVSAILKSHSMDAEGLIFELTERGTNDVLTHYSESLRRIQMLGCRLSIDDFGTGFSSLQRLCQTPFSEIKLDGEMVRSAIHDVRVKAVLQAMIVLGNTLGISVILEGIETEEQRQTLIDIGGVTGQGYLCARPMSSGSLLQWFERQKYSEAECI